MKITIGSDHAGFALKKMLIDHLKKNGHQLDDVGTDSTQPVDYPDYAQAVAQGVLQGGSERGILICGSGVGASVAANKVPGIRAAVCHDSYSAHQGVEHDDLNVLVLGSRVVAEELAKDLCTIFLNARFTGEERHRRRLAKIYTIEQRYSIDFSQRERFRQGEDFMNPVTTPEKQTQSSTRAQNPLLELQKYGQSVWLDYIRRNIITNGELQKLIGQDGLRGITSNPSIFEKAIAGSTDYADFLAQLHAQGLSTGEIYERIAIRDIQDAADLLLPVYKSTNRRDGYVSLEVSPTLARDTQATIEEARRLWKAVGRPNVMIKVPGTAEGVPAVRQLTSESINVNITLLFAQEAYEKVAAAYIEGLETAPKGTDLGGIASVASFFVSRIDSLVDSTIDARLKNVTNPEEEALLHGLQGKVAIANAKQAYRSYQAMISGQRWKSLAARGAQVQRLLWASTSTKNPKYRDVLYIEELIGPDTVNTIPPATMDAFRDHGIVRRTLDADLVTSDKIMGDLEKSGISMQKITNQLLEEAIKLFADAFEKLLAAVEQKKRNQ